MLKKKIILGIFIVFSQLHAGTNNSFNSEISHVAGGVVTAGAITYIVDQYYPEYAEHRGMLGFGISTVVFAAIEGYHIVKDGNAKGQSLDIASHALGSAIGAYVTDKYFLSPVIKTAPDGTQSVGVQVSTSF